MAEAEALENAGFISYTGMLDRLQQRFPDIPSWRIAQVIAAENEAVTGGALQIVPIEVEAGANEMLEREVARSQESGEVA
ncbi:hypothetical protein [Microbacterium sp. 179-I 3D3 NHS]|uniref:hypothetical protein n=1 Tax=unclassified Microbacterium TaxID=2609290 RepID=UPI0039A2C850